MLQAKNDRPNQKTVYLAFGSNNKGHFGRIIEVINESYALLHDSYLKIDECSPFYQTPAFPKGNGPDYVNAVIKAETSLSPFDLLAALHDVEARLGRVRTERWGARVIDIDLLDYQGRILPTPAVYREWREMPPDLQKTKWPESLILPHPRIQDRGFVLVPLRAVAPDWVHPVSHEHIDTLIGRIDPKDLRQIVQIPDS